MKYNILIIGIDSCRKESFQCYNPNRYTPFIQKFAEKSLIFDNYITTVTNTYQSWGCVFTGKYSFNSGIGIKPKEELHVKLMGKILSENGYYINIGDCTGYYQAMGSEVEYTKSNGELREPFFVFIGVSAHVPYNLSEEIFFKSNREELINAHNQTVEKLDSIIQSHIEKYLKYENTIIILTADHGDLIINGWASHHDNLNSETTDIPFILYHPHIKPRRVSGLFSNIDIFPTILGLCDIKYINKHNDKFDGMDLSLYISNELPFPDRTVQIGPGIGCKHIKQVYQGNGGDIRNIQNYDYSRKEVLMRYKDYRNREYVNQLFSQLEKDNYFKDEWKERSKTYNNLSSVHNKDIIDNIIYMLNLRPSLKIIDAGAGTGIISTAIAEKIDKEKIENIEIYAIDQCYSMLDICSNNKNIKKYVADIEHMMFIPDSSIDRIICRMVLHSEFQRATNIIDEFCRVLKKDGILVICEGVPMNDSLLDFYKSFLLKKEKRDVFTKDNLIKIVSSNFHNIESKDIILKRQSIKNWLDNSRTEKDLADEIFRIHIQSSKEIKDNINMVEDKDDIFCDWNYTIIKCTK